MGKFRMWLDESRNYEKIITSLRAKTTKNGATAAEERAAQAKAQELERKHKPAMNDGKYGPGKRFRSKEAHYAWMAAMERDMK